MFIDAEEMLEIQEEIWISKHPKCVCCGKHITDEELYDLGGDLLHAACLDKEFKKDTYLYVRREQVL